METPFQLLKVPPFHRELTIKANHSGITVLKESRYRKRYTGSKQSAVDINGKLYLKATELKKINLDIEQKKAGALSKRPQPLKVKEGNKDKANQAPRKKSYRVHKTEVRNRITGMINTIRGRKELYFWTVTFPEKTPDDLCYRLFNTWLTTLRQNKWLREYLWIAERQTGERLENKSKATNTIHFHIAIPHYISVKASNKCMQVTLATAVKRKEINFSVYQCKRYNGVHIAKDKKTGRVVNFALKKKGRALGNYLTKYITKNNAAFDHLAWHNSRGYSAIFTGITFTTSEFLGYGFRQLVKPGAIINNEYFWFFAWKDHPPDAISKHLFELNSFIQESAGILAEKN